MKDINEYRDYAYEIGYRDCKEGIISRFQNVPSKELQHVYNQGWQDAEGDIKWAMVEKIAQVNRKEADEWKQSVQDKTVDGAY